MKRIEAITNIKQKSQQLEIRSVEESKNAFLLLERPVQKLIRPIVSEKMPTTSNTS